VGLNENFQCTGVHRVVDENSEIEFPRGVYFNCRDYPRILSRSASVVGEPVPTVVTSCNREAKTTMAMQPLL